MKRVRRRALPIVIRCDDRFVVFVSSVERYEILPARHRREVRELLRQYCVASDRAG